MLLGWGAALLLQLAHPLVGAGITGHSAALRSHAARRRRLRHTADFTLALTFGSPDQARRAVAHVRGIHRYVHGATAEGAARYPDGTPYSAEDPELLRFVYATMIDALLRACALYVGPLTAEQRDRFCAEAA